RRSDNGRAADRQRREPVPDAVDYISRLTTGRATHQPSPRTKLPIGVVALRRFQVYVGVA
ncbi:MAG TPA: hypothetical protein VGP92_11560, partial [Acidimicrobiia bacterium]|nr:hypothetical protein [Acidimicrobiia bacterium]